MNLSIIFFNYIFFSNKKNPEGILLKKKKTKTLSIS